MKNDDVELLELNLLIKAIYKRYGFDFNHYKKASLQRSVKRLLLKRGLSYTSELIPLLLRDDKVLEDIVCCFSIPVSEFFRDPKLFLVLREKLVPILKTYPFIKIWHAGCAGGEEVYSMAILLQEEGLLERSRIYATDINPHCLEKAKEGIFSIDKVNEYRENYKTSAGKSEFDDYFNTRYDNFIIKSQLKKNIFFFNHNLSVDRSFGEMNLIMCRNVLIYFDKTLQEKTIDMFNQSLRYGGFLCLGLKESIDFLDIDTELYAWNKEGKIYRKGDKIFNHKKRASCTQIT